MKNKDVSYIFIIVLLLGACVVSWNLYFKEYTRQDTVDISIFPKKINSWTSKDIPLSPTELAILETDNAFVRKYTSPKGEEVQLFIVYSQNNRKVSHPPEICYTGGGATILDSQQVLISNGSENPPIKANQFTVERRRGNQMVAYWFKVGEDFTPNYWKQQGMIALKSFFGQPSSSALIRISATFDEERPEESTRLITNFGAIIVPYLHEYLP